MSIGLRQLEIFLTDNHIDIALISKTHFTDKNDYKLQGYKAYWTNYPSSKAREGTAIFVKDSVKHTIQKEIKEEYFQSTVISINYNNRRTYIGAVYCPPKHGFNKEKYLDMFNIVGQSFILACDWNAKQTKWGSRLTTKRRVLKAINEYQCDVASPNKPT